MIQKFRRWSLQTTVSLVDHRERERLRLRERERERENLNCILNRLVIYIGDIYILSVLEVYSVSQSVEKKIRFTLFQIYSRERER